MQKENSLPKYPQLIEATFSALQELGGSGKNKEIESKVYSILNLSDGVLSIAHSDNSTVTEINYRLAWARTLLKNYGAIENSARTVWSISPDFMNKERIDGSKVEQKVHDMTHPRKNKKHTSSTAEVPEGIENVGISIPSEIRPWREKLYKILLNMKPYSFEKLSQRLLRECGFEDVKVTKESRDGGIDGTGKFKINGILSFNIAFQCKRYSGTVSSPVIRDFRGSLTTDIEKGVFITTGTFSQDAIHEAETPGKKKIDLMDGEAFISKLAEYGIGLKEVKDYEIDEEYFSKI